jgi:serine phosphatase RsbU (regulator of sigma subunit)
VWRFQCREVLVADLAVAFSSSIGSMVTSAVEWTAAILVCSALYSILIMTVFQRRNQQRATDRMRLFAALYLAAFSGASVLIVDRALALVAPLFLAPIPILFLLFFYVFPTDDFAPRWARWLGILLAISFAFSFAPSRPSSQSANAAQIAASHVPGLVGGVMTLSNVVALLAILVGIVPQLYYRYLHFSVTGERSQPAAEAVPWKIALIPASFLVLLGLQVLVGAEPAASGPGRVAASALSLLLAVCPIAGGYALFERRPYDWEALSNRLLIYGLLTSSLLVVYVASIVALLFLFPGFNSLPPFGYIPFFVLVGLLMATLFQPLGEQVQQRIDRRLYPRKYDATTRITAFAGTMAEDTSLDALGRRLTEVVLGSFAPAVAQLWVHALPEATTSPGAPALARNAASVLETKSTAGEIRLRWLRDPTAPLPAGRAAVTILGTDPAYGSLLRPGSILEVERQPSGSVLMQELRADGVTLVVPLVSRGELAGLLTLGPRLKSHRYSFDDCRLLAILADTCAPELRHAQRAFTEALLARHRERIEQELQTARLIQESLLPKAVPEVSDWGIAACYRPAREVGGDFYDFLALADRRVGIVLGDVTDKGIPAALVMATTRSMLRAVAAQPAASPGDVLAQVNELLCADLPAGMFVTCFYAILDPATGHLQYANGGQDLPYLRQADGVTSELRATGLPLGLMPGSRYEECEAMLSPGCSLLFYSDGLVEAHNPEREMFGFHRLRGLIGEYDGAASPIAFLLDALATFTGEEWEQEDDITVVTLAWEKSLPA